MENDPNKQLVPVKKYGIETIETARQILELVETYSTNRQTILDIVKMGWTVEDAEQFLLAYHLLDIDRRGRPTMEQIIEWHNAFYDYNRPNGDWIASNIKDIHEAIDSENYYNKTVELVLASYNNCIIKNIPIFSLEALLPMLRPYGNRKRRQSFYRITDTP